MSRAGAEPTRDVLGRPLGSLRLSVTDRCNMRCGYCMPEEHYVWLPRSSLLTFEEMTRLVGLFTELGVRKIRLTGGEPLLRHDLPELVRMIRANPAVEDLALTTNGLLLAGQAVALRQAGLSRVTLSLDTLRPERLRSFARSDRHADILRGLEAARRAGFSGTKVNSVVIRGYNDDELVDLIAFGRAEQVEIRFIEYMDVGGATQWTADAVVSRRTILDTVSAALGPIAPVMAEDGAAPAERFRLADGTVFGVIASTTAPFCRACDRSRIAADGMWFRCLYAADGIDLRAPLRAGADDSALRAQIAAGWRTRTDRGAEQRLETPGRSPLYSLGALRQDPHREMHTRGG